jgi:hypothetical protein
MLEMKNGRAVYAPARFCMARGAVAGPLPNLCLQQLVTAVTVRAKHGPRQPRPLLMLVLCSQKLR